MKIGLLVIATGKYDRFVMPLLDSVAKYFMKKHDVTAFVFSDSKTMVREELTLIHHPHEQWPNPTLKRYHTFDKHKEMLMGMDYLYYCDADMLFVSKVGDEVLPEGNGLVATEHPGFFGGRRGSYEKRPLSTAYVSPSEGTCYYAGGFNGGSSSSYLKMAAEIKNRIDIDLKENIIAVWHDESHMNRYFIDYPPKKILSPSYCYGESMNIPFKKRLLALDKNHTEIRS